MERIKTFITTSLLGGLAVILPVTRSNFQELAAGAIVLGIILSSSCFLVGAIVKTKLGQFFRGHFENVLSKFVPGYGMIKSTVVQIFDRKKYPFSSVALVQAFENDTLMTGFVIDKHPDDIYTVFVPCGPNPTTGYIFHLQQQYVHPVTVSVENALRSVISCGVGSKPLLDAFHQIPEGKQA